MSVAIKLKAGSLTELNASTKVIQQNEIIFVREKGLLVAKETGPANAIAYEEFPDSNSVDNMAGRTAAPKGVARLVSMKTSNVAVTVQHDGTGGATGICYVVTGGTPVYAAVAANTSKTLSVPHKSGAPFEIWVWPSSAANGGVKGNLIYLDCYSSYLTSLDVSGLTALATLSCTSNSLTSLDVSNNTALTSLNCYSNSLTSLDVSNNTALTNLSCPNNSLTSLDLSNNTALTDLNCNYNSLTSLVVSGLTALTTLHCSSNSLTSLDVSNNTVLSFLSCSDNSLTSLDVSGCTVLSFLSCSSNSLTSLDVSECTALTSLNCSSNSLTSLRALGLALSYGSGQTSYGNNLKNNNLSAAALDRFYTDLAEVAAGTLLVSGNPGTTGDDPTIATDNGYTVVGT